MGVQFIFITSPTETNLFGNTFLNSRDSRHFKFTDFRDFYDEILFDNVAPAINVFMDFAKLRKVCPWPSAESPPLVPERDH